MATDLEIQKAVDKVANGITLEDFIKRLCWKKSKKCPVCGKLLIVAEFRKYYDSCDSITEDEYYEPAAKPTYICDNQKCKLYGRGFYSYEGQWYTINIVSDSLNKTMLRDVPAVYMNYFSPKLKAQYINGIFIGKNIISSVTGLFTESIPTCIFNFRYKYDKKFRAAQAKHWESFREKIQLNLGVHEKITRRGE